MISESRYLWARVFPEDRFGAAPEPVYCGDHHTTPAQARKHAKSAGYTHTVRWTKIGREEPYRPYAGAAPALVFTIEDDDYSPFVAIDEPYRTAILKLSYVPTESESNDDP